LRKYIPRSKQPRQIVEQNEKPWYEWEGVSFYKNAFCHNNGYRDHYVGEKTTNNYLEFVGWYLGDSIAHLKEADSTDFEVINPVGQRFLLTSEDLDGLPLVKEFLQREELKKNYLSDMVKIKKLEKDKLNISSELKQTDKYSELYLLKLQDQYNLVNNELNEFKQTYSHEGEYQNQMNQLDEILKGVDEELRMAITRN
jgi:hypothetical protein